MTSQSVTAALDTAVNNVECAFTTAKKKKPNYLKADFGLTFKESEQATAIQLVNSAYKLYMASPNPNKYKQVQRIFSRLEVMDSSPMVAERVKLFVAAMEKNRLTELPDLLARLVASKQELSLVMEAVEVALPTIRLEDLTKKYLRVIQEKTAADGTSILVVELTLKPSNSEIESILSSKEGSAFIARFPFLFDDSNSIAFPAYAATVEELDLLRSYIRHASPLTARFATFLMYLIQGNHAKKRYVELNKRIPELYQDIFAKYTSTLTSSKRHTLSETMQFFPPFQSVMGIVENLSLSWDLRNPQSHRDWLAVYRKCKVAEEGAEILHAQYASLYEEYVTLAKKCSSAETPVSPTDSSPLPTPSEFAKIRFSMDNVDPAPTWPDLPSSEPVRDKAKDEKHALEEPVVKAREPLPKPNEDRGDTKENVNRVEDLPIRARKRSNEDSKGKEDTRPSPFADRVFPFDSLQYADRVLEWETDPKKALERPEYRNLPDHAVDEVIWKHATNVVDQFIGTPYSRQHKWKDKDLAYIIQAQVEWQGKTYKGFFRYAFNDKGVMYHRDFGEKTNIQLVDAICKNKEFGDEDFPTFEQAQKDYHAKGKPVQVVKQGSTSYKIDALDIVTVEDPKYGLKIHLFKRGKV